MSNLKDTLLSDGHYAIATIPLRSPPVIPV